MKIGRFIGNPCEEFGHRAMSPDMLRIIANARQFSVGEISVDRLVADRVNRNRAPTLLGLGHRVVPLDQGVKAAPAKPAGEPLAHPLSVIVRVG